MTMIPMSMLDEALDAEIDAASKIVLDVALALRELKRCRYADGQELTNKTLRSLLVAAKLLSTVGDLFRRISAWQEGQPR